jgi:hypothetical protein
MRNNASSGREFLRKAQQAGDDKYVSFTDLRGCTSLSDTRSIPSLSDLSDEDICRQWLGPEDFTGFKVTAKQIAKQARLSGFNDLLKTSFGSSNNDIPATRDPLLRWACYGHSRRGLEQWTSPPHGDERRERKKIAIKALLKAQDVLRMVGADHKDTATQLARLSKKYSTEAATFAQRMGKADAHAAMLVESGSAITRRRSLSSGDLRSITMTRSTLLAADQQSGDLKNDSSSSLGSPVLPREVLSRYSSIAT